DDHKLPLVVDASDRQARRFAGGDVDEVRRVHVVDVVDARSAIELPERNAVVTRVEHLDVVRACDDGEIVGRVEGYASWSVGAAVRIPGCLHLPRTDVDGERSSLVLEVGEEDPVAFIHRIALWRAVELDGRFLLD